MKSNSGNSNLISVLATIMAVIFLGAIYFFIYLPGNEKAIQQQGFRTLQNIDNNIHAKVSNGTSLLNNLIIAYQDQKTDAKALDGYIKNYSRQNFILSISDVQQELPQGVDSLSRIETGSTNQLEINLKKRLGQKILQMKMRFDVAQFISPLLPKGVFDQYIVFNKGKVIYQTFPSGITSANQDSLAGMKNGMGSSGVWNRTISGTEYKLFLQPVSLTADNNWVIAGLISNTRYQSEKNQLPPRIVLLLITIAMIIFLIFPWLKLYQMGSRDRLTVSDGLSSLVISMLLMSFLFFSFFKYNVPFRPDSSPDSKQILSQKITAAFKNEIEAAYNKLTAFDLLISKNPQLKTDIRNLGKDNLAVGNSYLKEEVIIAPGLKNELTSTARGITLNQVFWLDKNGFELFNWTNNSYNVPHGNFRTRDYHQKIVSDKAYSFLRNNKKKYYLDQLISWTSGTFTTVISKPSLITAAAQPAVVAMSFDMKSLLNTILPSGYSFIIIDKQGRVLYHSDKTRNLNENLLDEFSEKNKLTSSLEAQSKSEFATDYLGKEYAVNIQPISNLPYFIAILGDINFKETRDMEIYSFTISMLLILFSFLIVELIVVFLASARRSVYKRQMFDTSWVGPRQLSHRQYAIAAMANTVIILLLFFFFLQSRIY